MRGMNVHTDRYKRMSVQQLATFSKAKEVSRRERRAAMAELTRRTRKMSSVYAEQENVQAEGAGPEEVSARTGESTS